MPDQLASSRRTCSPAPITAPYTKPGAGGLRDVVFFTNNTGVQLKVLAITERHIVAEATAGSLTVSIVKVPSGTAVGSGTALHGTAINLKGTINTNAAPTLGDIAALTLADGDSLGADFSAAGTEIADTSITVLLEPLVA